MGKLLCFGTVFKLILSCKTQGMNQQILFNTISEIAGYKSGDDNSNISSYVNGKKVMPGAIGRGVTELSYQEFCESVKDSVVPKIAIQNKPVLVYSIKELIEKDDLPDDTQIGFSDRYSAKFIRENDKYNFVDFLSNILFYVITQVDNTAYRSVLSSFNAKQIIKKNKTKCSNITLVNEEEDSLFSMDNINDSVKNLLYIETHGQCPMCSHTLIIKDEDSSIPDGEMVLIDPLKQNVDENLIMLCSVCAKKYKENITNSKISELKSKKENIKKRLTAKSIVDESNIKDGITAVLKSLQNRNFDYNAKGNMNPVTITEKLSPGNEDLLFDLKNYITLFDQIDQISTALTDEGDFSFEIARQRIHILYLELKNLGLSKHEVFEKIVECLQNNSNGGSIPCKAVATYFIQKCDVFDANPK